MVIRIAICDDSAYIREETRKYILKYSFKNDFEYSLDEYDSGEELLGSNRIYDLIFMDYQFEKTKLDGISIAKELRRQRIEATIIFLSSYPGVVFQTFEVGTFRFLVKPIEEDKFNDAINSFLNTMEKEQILTVRMNGMNHFIKENAISYVEGYGKYCIIHFVDKRERLECHETLASVESRLPFNHFYRCHKSFLVNLKYVASYNRTDLILENGESILISRNQYKEFTEAYADYLAGRIR